MPPSLRNYGIPSSASGPSFRTAVATLPPRIENHLHRPRLLEQCQAVGKRLAILQAPCGFGKTALLVDICNRERDRGALVAWLGIDEAASGDRFLDDVAFALERAGMDLSSLRPFWTDGQSPEQRGYRVGLLLRATENCGQTCLLALDGIERLDTTEAMEVLELLLYRAPPNLHFAMTMRSIPQRLNLANLVLERNCSILTAEDLRFSKPEIANLLDGPISREQLVTAATLTEGWPAAVGMYANQHHVVINSSTLSDMSTYEQLVADYLDRRLFLGLGDESRGFLLDVALFDTFDPILLDDVLPSADLKCRTDVLVNLRGLFRPVRPDSERLCLHPLVRDYCRRRRLREDGTRCQQLHSRIASALVQRDQLKEAMRHVGESGDESLRGRLLEESGMRVMLRQGIEQFLGWSRDLSPETRASYPRVADLRRIALVLDGRVDEARSRDQGVGKRNTRCKQVQDGGEPAARTVEGVIAESVMSALTCKSVGDAKVHRLLKEAAGLADDEALSPELRGSLNGILAVAYSQQARFRLGRRRAARAKRLFACTDAVRGLALMDLQDGVVAMAQGRVRDATAAFTPNRPNAISKVLLAELQIERNKMGGRELGGRVTGIPHQPLVRSGWFDVHAAVHGNRIESAFERGGVDAALDAVEDSLAYAFAGNLSSLTRLLFAQKVHYLVAAEQTEEARRAWDAAELPKRMSDQLDLDKQSWREMESIACARINLLQGEGNFESARRLALRLRNSARERGLIRTVMRCLAEAIELESRANNPDGAAERMWEYLRLFRTTDYSRPLVRKRNVSLQTLQRLTAMDLKRDTRRHADSLMATLDKATARSGQELWGKAEKQVIDGLAKGLRNKEIARRLGLTENGVRYHLKKIYRKLGVSGRSDAAQLARNMPGIVS